MIQEKILKNNFGQILNVDNLTLAYGHFSTIHPGHIRYLINASKKGSKLAIALIGDEEINGKNKFVFSQYDRALSLSSISFVDFILCMDDSNLDQIIETIKPKFLVLGNEFESSKDKLIISAINLIKRINGQVFFDSGETNYASSAFLNSNVISLSEKKRKEFINCCKKQRITKLKMIESITKWQEAKVIVIGDSIIDQYAACEAIGMSAEAPVVVVKELKNKNFIGGAAIVAAHIAALGGRCEFLSITGNDEESKFLSLELEKLGIKSSLIVDEMRPTTLKKRYIVNSQKIFRVSKFEENHINTIIEDQLIQKLERLAPRSDSIIISDFLYGVITPKLLESIKSIVKKFDLQLIGDMQCSSQIGQITKFKDFSLLCPNEREARIAINDKDSGLETISQKLIHETRSQKLLMKLGGNGFIFYEKDLNGQICSQYFPAVSGNPLDLAGAGDSVLAVMALGLSTNQSTLITSSIAACMAAVSVEQMGNTPIDQKTLQEKIVKVFDGNY